MQIITLQDPRLLLWAGTRLKATFLPDRCKWIAGAETHGVVWVVVYTAFSERNCWMTIATDGSKRWASRAMLRASFTVPFVWNGLARVSMLVRADNDASLKMMQHRGKSPLGVTPEGRLRDFFNDGVDGLLFGMLAKECRWLK